MNNIFPYSLVFSEYASDFMVFSPLPRFQKNSRNQVLDFCQFFWFKSVIPFPDIR